MSRKRLALFLAVVFTVAILAIVALTVYPVQRNYEGRYVGFWDATLCSGIVTVDGTTVTFHWWAPSNVSFAAVSCSTDTEVYRGVGTGGGGGFVSHGGTYEFGTLCPPTGCTRDMLANVSVNYSRPFLVV
ncbi:MAG: hypothetical protein WBG19_00945 [Thermoplasmata archaeon]